MMSATSTLSALAIRRRLSTDTFRSPRSTYHWRPTTDSDQLALYIDGQQIGVYRRTDHKFVPLDILTRTWGPPTDRAPIEVPSAFLNSPPLQGGARGGIETSRHAGELREADGTPNFGIDLARMPPAPSYSINGRAVSREAALSAVAHDGLSDDSGKLRVTIIGAELDCVRVQQALAASAVHDRIHIKSYRPDDPMVACGFVTTGTPTVYIQDNRGKTLHRQDAVTNPEQVVAAVREAERRRQPNYDPGKDPDLTKPALPDLANVPTGAWIVAAVAAFLFVITRKLPPHQPNGAPQ